MERSARCLELALQVRDLEERRGRAAGESTPLRQQINGLEETLAQELAAAERERERLPAQLAEAAADAKQAEDKAAAAIASLEQRVEQAEKRRLREREQGFCSSTRITRR
eukprot:gene1443-biopygen1148